MSIYNLNKEDNLMISKEEVEKNPMYRMVDSEGEVTLYSPDHNNLKDSIYRGIVFYGDKYVGKGFDYTPIYTNDSHKNHEEENKLFTDIKKCRVFDSFEGTILKMFFLEGENRWFISTNRKLNAFKSTWSSKKDSFGSLFKKALEFEAKENTKFLEAIGGSFNVEKDNIIEKLESILDKNKQYMFLLLSNSDNRIVCKNKDNSLYFVASIENGLLNVDDKLPLNTPNELFFNSFDELYNYIDYSDFLSKQGVIIFTQDNKHHYKIFNDNYNELYEARGNEPSIKFRYLQVRRNKKLVDALKYLYPEFIQNFDDYEHNLFNIASNIHVAYVNRFIKKMYTTVNSDEYQVIKACHTWHSEDRFVNKINLDKVFEFLELQSPSSLNHMIKRYILDKKKSVEDSNNVSEASSVKPQNSVSNKVRPSLLKKLMFSESS